jgi:ABC-type multidrug transport system ATPase subunit
MTVEEHLYFYARIKGIGPNEEASMVQKALKEVQLHEMRSLLVSELPLGAKRRLSIAISLVSNPRIIFLDEPTTGLDPDTRRQLWNILQDVKKGGDRAMVLTTHSMEEADVLCNRIGIVNNGVVQCLGTQNRLKQQYGGGYHMFINCDKTKGDKVTQNIVNFVLAQLPNSKLLREFNCQLHYQVPIDDFRAEIFFKQMENNKNKLAITDWGIS